MSLIAPFAACVRRFVVRHWRGELPLWVAFWVVGVLANLLAWALVTLLVSASGLYRGYNPYLSALTIVGIWLSASALVIWQMVGVWRTASRYVASRTSVLWARLAQLVVVLGVIGASIDAATVTYPQLVEAAKIGLLGDPELPDYRVDVSRDGRALEVAGGIKYGLAREIERVLRAAPEVDVVRLDSIGGRSGEAETIFDIVRRFDLDTHVARECLSACTLVFAAGRQRWLGRGARLGYHGIAFPGYTDADLAELGADWYARLVTAGVAPDFVERARRVPSRSMWYPTPDELFAAGVVTGVVADDLFGLRHAEPVTEADIARELRRWAPLYATMETVAPQAFAAAMAVVGEGFALRHSDAEISRQLRIHLHRLLQHYRARADDPTLLAVGAAHVEQLAILRRVDRELCHAHARGTADLATLVDRLPPERLAQEQALAERVLQTTALRAAPDAAALEPGRRALLQRLRDEVGPDSLALLQLAEPDELQRRRLCDVYVTLYSAILAFDDATASTLLRYGFAGP